MALRKPRPRGSSLSREEKRRIYRRRQLAVVLTLVVVCIALLMGTALGAARLTSGSGMCRQCHEMQPYYKGWQQSAPKTCSTCHPARHAAYGECDLCHTKSDWTPVSPAEAARRGFSHPFALTGRHATLKCAGCHKTSGTAKATTTPATTCGGCHGDKHKGLTDCTRCHATGGWTPANFAHPGVSGMNWRGMACSDCHPNGYATHTCTTCHEGGPPGD